MILITLHRGTVLANRKADRTHAIKLGFEASFACNDVCSSWWSVGTLSTRGAARLVAGGSGWVVEHSLSLIHSNEWHYNENVHYAIHKAGDENGHCIVYLRSKMEYRCVV